ncbi:MAG: hypothetical protein HY675_13810 [Chloroflexi bacterium]|nr:hypothetical protein [Chloroflexota bacterium]
MTRGRADPMVSDAIKHALIADMIQELESDEDPQRALRKALLCLIDVVQADVPEVVSPFITYLLTEFAPLSAYFKDDLHPFVHGEEVQRSLIVDDKVGLLRVWLGGSF